MGPVNNSKNYQAKPSAEIYHFAHIHPLQLSHHHHPRAQCAACTYLISAPAYGCQHCNYYLHVSCSKMPQQLQHPYNTKNAHSLTLLPKPVYTDGRFSCDACGHQGSGFSYHCPVYRIDLHILCATLPSVASVTGHHHQLTRVFSPPYADKKFKCDVCREPGSKTWLYRCSTCQFDVHMGCAGSGGVQQPEVHHVQPVIVQPAYPMVYYQPIPVADKPGLQIVEPIVNGGLTGICEALAQNLANVAIGAFTG